MMYTHIVYALSGCVNPEVRSFSEKQPSEKSKPGSRLDLLANSDRGEVV